jgi:hypothetical protein
MKCRSCGLEIAEKAIVCYRCGAPTSVGAPVRPAPVQAPRDWVGVPLVMVMIAMGGWVLRMTPPGTAVRWSAWTGEILVSVALVLFLWARRRARVPRR